MTRRSDLMCEDIFGCEHTPEVPVSEDGEIVGWYCRCGANVWTPEQIEERNRRAKEKP